MVHVWNLERGASDKTIPVFEVSCYFLFKAPPTFLPVHPVQAVEGMVLLPDSLMEVDGPVKRALPVHKKKKVNGLLFATAGDRGVVKVWMTGVGVASPCLLSCRPLATPPSFSELDQDSSRERETAHVFTGLHLCPHSQAVCGITHDHNLVTYDLPHFTLVKEVTSWASNGGVAHVMCWQCK